MKTFAKAMTGAAAAALVTVGAAAPAQAQYYDRYHDRDRGIDVGDIVAGVAVAGAAAAAIGAIANATRGGYGSYGNYGYGNRAYGYGNYGYNDRYAVDTCANRASRYGRVSVTDVRPRSRNALRVQGVVDGNGGYYNRGYGYERRAFQCDVRYDGRVTYFDTDRIRY